MGLVDRRPVVCPTLAMGFWVPLQYSYQVHGLPPHSLRNEDLNAWNCNRASQLLQEASSETTWVYLDGSAGQGGFGSAATIYKPNGTILVLCLPSPYHSSEGSEYWAGIMFLRWVSSLNQPMRCIILEDNEQVICTANVQSYVMASRSTHGTWVKAYSFLQAQMPTFVSTQFAWIKGHAGFQGNECSDLFSKWIAYSSSSSSELLPPPPLGTVSFGSLPVCHQLTTSVSRALIPRHHHYNIHVPSSFFFYNHSSWFSGLPSKWSSGNMNFLTFAFHNDLTPRICHKYSQSHPLHVVSFLSHRPSADHIEQSFIHAWPPPFHQVASIWWAQCSHSGDKRNFVKFTVPSTLYEAMTTPITGKTKPQRVLAFKNALPQRQRQLKDALSKALTWLAEDPPHLPRPPPKVPTPGANHTAPTARHTPHRRTAITAIPCL